MLKSILPWLAAFLFLLVPLWTHAGEIQLERQLADDELLTPPDSITASLYTAPYAGVPVVMQTYFPGEWKLAEEGTARLLRVTLDPAVEGQQALWYELEADGLLLGERQALSVPASGVTLAAGNRLDMDGNLIINLAMPDAPGDNLDAANRAYVDNANITGNAATATQLAADGANCNTGEYPLGVDKSGAVQGCTSDAKDDPVSSAELDAVCNQDGKILKRSAGSWACASGESGSGDDLGDHTATQNLQLGSLWLSGDGDDEGIRVDTVGKVGINSAPGAANLQVGGLGGFVVTGTHDSGSIPAEGQGTRIMWYPGKSALRAGYVDYDEWDAANIGPYSTAMGSNTIASGYDSMAMGNGTTASGSSSTALGDGTIASGNDSTALGNNTTASDNASTAIGAYTTASGSTSTAMGSHTTASGGYSTAMGFDSTASGSYSTAMGNGTTANGYASTAMGRNIDAESYAETVVGHYNTLASSPDPENWIETDRLFVIGNGTGTGARSNALVVLKNGETSLDGQLTVNGDSTVNGVASQSSSGNTPNLTLNQEDGTDSARLRLQRTGEPNFWGLAAGGASNRFDIFLKGTGNLLTLHSDCASGGTDLLEMNNGASLTCGGTWTNSSDRTRKTGLAPVDTSAVLTRVIGLPLSEWSYKQEQSARHMGPMAQDFHIAFGLGHSEKSIATIDADGVALAAIQGLNAKLEAEVAARKAEITALQQRLAAYDELGKQVAALQQRLEQVPPRLAATAN